MPGPQQVRFSPTALALTHSLLASREPSAQPRQIRPEHDDFNYGVVLRLPGMDRVTVDKDLPYKTVGGQDLLMDLYLPAPGGGKGTSRPALVFINGVGDPPNTDVRTWGQYRSWARLAAVSGWVAVNFQARAGEANAEDVRDVLSHLARRGQDYGIDPASLAIQACSTNVAASLPCLAGDASVRLKAATRIVSTCRPTRISLRCGVTRVSRTS